MFKENHWLILSSFIVIAPYLSLPFLWQNRCRNEFIPGQHFWRKIQHFLALALTRTRHEIFSSHSSEKLFLNKFRGMIKSRQNDISDWGRYTELSTVDYWIVHGVLNDKILRWIFALLAAATMCSCVYFFY